MIFTMRKKIKSSKFFNVVIVRVLFDLGEILFRIKCINIGRKATSRTVP